MKRISLILLLICCSLLIKAQTFSHVIYQPSDSNIANPERGFFHAHDVSSQGQYENLDLNELIQYRQEGITLIYRGFYLENFVSSDISGQYLNGMRKDFEIMRQAGIKVVIRFAYGDSMFPPYIDAPLDIALRHIEQLKPVLQENGDVILAQQAGFIGAWGEWYYTSNYALSPGVILEEHWQMRRDLVNAMLDALPENRMVLVRTPKYKQRLLQSDEPVTEAQAYSSIPVARIGHHNDCFVSSPDDYGTYDDTLVEKAYLEADTRYTMINGETCDPDPPYSDCPNSLKELRRFHWTCLNRDYNGQLLNGWINQGCFGEVQRKLGYRYRLITADIQDSAKIGGELQLNIKLINEGWSNPVNPRKLEIVIRNNDTEEEYVYPISEDPRYWSLGDTVSLTISAGVPQAMSAGEYSMFFSMPDPEISLYFNPNYSIRLANTGSWEQSTGLNSLQVSVIITDNPELPGYNGTGFFYPRKSEIVQAATIIVDGQPDDWQGIPEAFSTTGQPAESIKVYNDSDSLYLLVTGMDMQPSFQFFIDADNNLLTGYPAWQWNSNGSDYLIENDLLYKYSGITGEWSWELIKAVHMAQNTAVIEAAIALNDLQPVSLGNPYSFAFVNDPQNTVQTCYLPLQNDYFIYSMKYLDNPREIRGTVFQNNVITYWAGTSDDQVVHILERSSGDDNYQTVSVMRNNDIAFRDSGLEENTTYKYRIYRTDGIRISAATPPVSVTTLAPSVDFLSLSVDGAPGDWLKVKPLATAFSGNLIALRTGNFGDSLFFNFEGIDAADYVIYLNTDRNSSTGLPNIYTGTPGYDIRINNDSLFKADNLAWVFTGAISGMSSESFYEGGMELSEVDLQDAGSAYISARVNGVDLPGIEPEVEFVKLPEPQAPAYFLVKNSQVDPFTKIIIEWSMPDNCEGYIIERSVSDSSHFTILTQLPRTTTWYHDNTVNADTAYYYRMFSYFDINRSAYTPILGGYPGQMTWGIGESAFNAGTLRVYPNPFQGAAKVELYTRFPQDVNVSVYSAGGLKLVDLFRGETYGYHYMVLDKDQFTHGIYFIRVVGNFINLSEKVIVY